MTVVEMSISFEDFDLKKGAGAALLFLTITGVVTGLIPNPIYVRMVPITFLDYLFLFTTSALAGLYFGKESCSVLGGRLAGLGGLTGFLAFGCPVCNALLLAFFSSSAIMTYFDPLRPFLGVLSTALLGFFVYRDYIAVR